MIGVPLGLLSANAIEWFFHKHVLHGRRFGKSRQSFWSFHFYEHHQASRKHAMHDEDYRRSVFHWNGQGKEALALGAATLGVLPWFPVTPFFAGTLVYSAVNYYRKHRRSHLDPDWARTHLPWHYDHHMGPDQDANWCVTKPWFDHLMGTRKPYLGTEREQRDLERLAERRERIRKKTA